MERGDSPRRPQTGLTGLTFRHGAMAMNAPRVPHLAPLEYRSLRLELPGGTGLHYVEAGQGEPMVLLHGGMGDCWSWGPQIEAFASRFRVVSYSRRYNYPNSNRPSEPNHSCRHEAQDLGAFLAKLRCGPVHLVGTSYGALTALTYAIDKPGEILSLVLAEPPMMSWVRAAPDGAVVCDAFVREVWEPAARAFAQGCTRQAMRYLYDGMRGQGSFDTLHDAQVQAVLRNARAMEMLLRSTEAFPEVPWAAVVQLRLPVLLISGERTVPFHRLAHDALVRALPQAQQVVIAGAGHAAASENPDAFNTGVLEFLARLER